MNKFFTILALFILFVIILFFILSYLSRSDNAVGIVNGKLSQCPDKPNCVCSEFSDDREHFIAPINIPENAADESLRMLKEAIQESGGVIQSESDTYLAGIYTSKFFRFIDDLEIRIDSAEGLIHIRSASRAGYGDMGVNSKRVELIKALFSQKMEISE